MPPGTNIQQNNGAEDPKIGFHFTKNFFFLKETVSKKKKKKKRNKQFLTITEHMTIGPDGNIEQMFSKLSR